MMTKWPRELGAEEGRVLQTVPRRGQGSAGLSLEPSRSARVQWGRKTWGYPTRSPRLLGNSLKQAGPGSDQSIMRGELRVDRSVGGTVPDTQHEYPRWYRVSPR